MLKLSWRACSDIAHRHGAGQLKIMYVGGPNTRADFHIEAGEEVPPRRACMHFDKQQLFYQLEGEANVVIMERGVPRNVNIKPGHVRHSSSRHGPSHLPRRCLCSRAASRTRPGAAPTPWAWLVLRMSRVVPLTARRWWSASACRPRSTACGVCAPQRACVMAADTTALAMRRRCFGRSGCTCLISASSSSPSSSGRHCRRAPGPHSRSFFASEQHRTGQPIPGDHLSPDPPIAIDTASFIPDPFNVDEVACTSRAPRSHRGSGLRRMLRR